MTFERHSDKEVYNIFKSNLCLLHMMSHIRMNEVAYLSSTYHHAIHSGYFGECGIASLLSECVTPAHMEAAYDTAKDGSLLPPNGTFLLRNSVILTLLSLTSLFNY